MVTQQNCEIIIILSPTPLIPWSEPTSSKLINISAGASGKKYASTCSTEASML